MMNEETKASLNKFLKEREERIKNMTLAEARNIVSSIYGHSDMRMESDKALQMLLDCADKALEQQPTHGSTYGGVSWGGTYKEEAQPNSNEFFNFDAPMVKKSDAVSREAVIRLVEQYPNIIGNRCSGLISDIKHLPPVKPQRKMGRWINKFGKEQGYDIAGIKTWYIQIMCDKCGFIKTAIEGHTGQYKFCPNCGAEMEEE